MALGTEGGGASYICNEPAMFSSRILALCAVRSYSTPAARHFPALKAPMLPPGTFEGKVAFVTGGGTGLGRGITHYLSLLGARVVISSRWGCR